MGGVIQGTHGGFDGDDDFRVGNSRGEIGVRLGWRAQQPNHTPAPCAVGHPLLEVCTR